MPTVISRKFFSRTVHHPGDGVGGSKAITLTALLQLEGWGFVDGANNAIGSGDPSGDSFIARECTLVPQTLDAFIGDNAFVSSAAAAGPPRLYRGSKATATLPWKLSEFFPPPIDADNVFVFSAAQDIEIIWSAI